MTHEQLDALFRANAERGDFAPAPGEWEAMTAMLEADERRARYGRWVSGAWGILFLALIAAGIWGAVAYAPRATRAGGLQVGALPLPVAGATLASAGASAKTLGPERASSPQTFVTAAAPTGPRVSSVEAAAPRVPPSAIASEGTPAAAARERGARRSVRSSTSPAPALTAAPASLPTASHPTVKDQSASRATDRTSVAQRPAMERAAPMDHLPDRHLLSPLSVRNRDGLGPVPVLDSRASPRVWTFSLVAAAEANQVEMDSPLAYGYRFGPRVDYRLNERVRLSAAALLGQRGYRASHEQTSMSSGLFVDEVAPSSMHGQSAIVELPLALSYYPTHRRGPRWFVSVALNSYRLFRDEITFTYDEHREGQFHAMRSDERDEAFAASLRLGGGVSLDVFGGTALEVGPYLQLPLRGTSYSEVSLYTAGLLVRFPVFAR